MSGSFYETVIRRFGQGSVNRLDGEYFNRSIEAIPTGSIQLDKAIGIGGYPRGRIIQIVGNPSSGKTTLCLHAIHEAQKAGGDALFIDAEYSLDVEYAKALGVDPEKMFVAQMESAEDALDVLEIAVKTGGVPLIVVDSVAAMSPIRELQGESGDAHIGLLARLMTQALRRLSGAISKSNACVIFVNQYRSNISSHGYGSPKTTPGGRALEYYSSLILDVARTGSNSSQGEAVSNKTRITVKKNKVGPPYRSVDVEIDFGTGLSKTAELIDLATDMGYIIKAGSWYKDEEGNSLAQGKENLKNYMHDNSEYKDSIEKRVRDEYFKGN